MTRFLPRLGLFLARFCTSAWIGAASLFVVVGVAEVTSGGFDSSVKDMLVAIRFPAYYVCGVMLLSAAFVGSLVAGRSESFPRYRRIATLMLLAMAIAIMAIDYLWIYKPLLEMVIPPGQAKPARFRDYHQASKWINFANIAICLAATVLANWPVKSKSDAIPKVRSD